MKTFLVFSSFLLGFFSLLCTQTAQAGTVLTSIKTEPNRAIFYGVGNGITGLSVSLNAEKTKLIALFNGVTISEKVSSVFGKGAMSDIDIVHSKGQVSAYIQLKEKQGFSVGVMPYSDALVIDVFSWENLSVSHDNYRSGLLALHDGIVKQAIPLLKQAAEAGIADACVYLGIELIKQARYDESLGWLKKGLQQQTSLPDVYAALCQISRVNGLYEEAKRYEKLFSEKTGIRSVLDIPVEYQPPLSAEQDNNEEPLSLASMIADESFSDTISKTAVVEKKDTTRFASLFNAGDEQKKTQNSEINNASLMPSWMKTMSVAIIAVISSLFLIMVILYTRWRKRRRLEMEDEEINEAMDEKEVNGFAKELALANQQSASTQTAIHRYGNNSINTLIEDDSEHIINDPVSSINELPHDRTMLEEFVSEVFERGKTVVEKGRSFVEERRQNPSSGLYEPEEQKDMIWEDESIISSPRGEFELAMHLQAKQRLHRSELLESLDTDVIPKQQFGISKIARKLGVETGSIETKRTFSHLQTDTRALNNLRQKFSKHDSVRFAR